MNTRLEGKENRQENRFEYLGRTLTWDGRSGGRKCVHEVGGLMTDRKIWCKLKGKILVSCVMPA